MAERIVDRVRGWLESGRTRLEAFQDLQEEGYGETVAEQIVEEASSAGTGLDTRKLLVASAVILLLIGGGAAFTILTLLPADGGADGTDGGGNDSIAVPPPDLSTIIDRTARSTYDVTYTVEQGNVTPDINVIAARGYRSGGEARKDVEVITPGGTRRFSVYDPVATSQVILCGDTGIGTETCTTDHVYLFITALALPDLLPFRNTLTDMTVNRAGNATVARQPCDRFTLRTTTGELYRQVGDQVRSGYDATAPIRIDACLDRGRGHVMELTIADINRTGGEPFRMTAATINTTLPPGTFTAPLPVALTADCGVDNATATLLALHPDTTQAALTVADTNRTVPLPQRYRPVRIPLGDLPSDTTTLTAYADGQTVTTPCIPLS